MKGNSESWWVQLKTSAFRERTWQKGMVCWYQRGEFQILHPPDPLRHKSISRNSGLKKKKKRHLVWLCINYCNKDVNLSDHCTMQFAVLCPVPARDFLLPAGAACSSWTKLATCQYLPRQASSSLHSVSVCRSKILPWGQTAEMLRLGYLRVALMQIGHHWGDLQNRHKVVLHCFIYH